MAAVEVDKVADMVAAMLADKKNMADMELERPGQFSVLWVGTELLRHLYRLSTKYNIGLRQYSRELLQY